MPRVITEAKKAEAKSRREKLRKFAKAIAELSDGDRATLASKMGGVTTIEGHALSLRNQCLLALQQKGDTPVTVVGGFRQWIKAGRVVKKGESAYWLRCPCEPKAGAEQDEDEDDDGKKSRIYFTFGAFFDVSQTDELTEEDKKKIAEREKRKAERKDKVHQVPAGKVRKVKARAKKVKAKPAKYQPTPVEDVDAEFNKLLGL